MEKSLKWAGVGFVVALAIAAAVTARLSWFPRPVGTSIVAATAAPPRFDLHCQGVDKRRGQQDLHLKVDLERGLYCEGECLAVLPINRADARSLVIEEEHGRHFTQTIVSRDPEGRLTYRSYFASNYDYRGPCKSSQFSGISPPRIQGLRGTIDLPDAPQRTLDANFLRQPDPFQRANAYPPWLRLFDVESAVRLRCVTDAQGGLANCAVISAKPAGFGLPAAALRLASKFQAAPYFWPAERVLPGTPVDLTFTFETGDD